MNLRNRFFYMFFCIGLIQSCAGVKDFFDNRPVFHDSKLEERTTTAKSKPVYSEDKPTSSSSNSKTTIKSGLSSVIVKNARAQIGTPYKFGAENPKSGFDCSGFTFYIYDQVAAIKIPRTSSEQALYGKKISLKNTAPGDIIYFKSKGRVQHVGIVSKIDKGQLFMVHSSSSRGVIEENVSTSSYWKPRLSGARRIISQ